MARVLTRLLQEPATRARMGESGRALVRERYSVAAVTAALETLYRDLSRQRKEVQVA